jgi:hypothetical protein
MTEEEEGLLVVGVIAVGAVLFLVLKGSNVTSNGISVAQANPTSVQALYTAQAADTAQQAQLSSARIAANAGVAKDILGFFSLSNNNAAGVATNGQNTASANFIAGQQANASEYAANQSAVAQLGTAAQQAGSNIQIARAQEGATIGASQAAGASAIGVAQATGSANVDVARANADSNLGIARANADASISVANSQFKAVDSTNAASHANAQTASKSAGFGSVINGIAKFFGV